MAVGEIPGESDETRQIATLSSDVVDNGLKFEFD